MLPFELIVEVLLRLPVKSLLRFMCVCKSWNALISGPEFAKKHLRTSAIMDPTHFFTRHHLILCPTYEPILRDYSLPSIFSCSGVTASATQLEFPPSAAVGSRSAFFGSCHGMLCIRNEQDSALMWNPCTGKFKTLPSLETPGVRGCPLIYSFGYDHFSDSYKVVALSWSVRHETDVKVHALGTDSWRAIQRFPANAPFHAGRFVSGMLNWLAKDIARPSWVIVSLDMGTETYQQLLPPDCLVDDVNFTLNLGVLHDSLCIVATCNQFSDVWVMKDYGNKESWTKLLVVPYFADYPQYAHHNDHDYSFPTALWISDEDDEVLLLLEWMLAVYNSNSGSFRTLGIPQLGHLIRAVVYAESLISPCF